MIYSYAAPMPMKLRPPLQNSEKLLIFGANLDEFLLTAKQIFINDATGKLSPPSASPDEPITVLVHLAEELPRLAQVGALRAHHLVHSGHHPEQQKTCFSEIGRIYWNGYLTKKYSYI